MSKHDREHSGARVLSEKGEVLHEYRPRGERTVLKNGSLATDLIQTSVPRWKVWLGHLFDVAKFAIGVGLVMAWSVEPRAERWIGSVVDARMAPALERLRRAEEHQNEHELREAERRGDFTTRAELEKQLDDIKRQLYSLRQQTERISR